MQWYQLTRQRKWAWSLKVSLPHVNIFMAFDFCCACTVNEKGHWWQVQNHDSSWWIFKPCVCMHVVHEFTCIAMCVHPSCNVGIYAIELEVHYKACVVLVRQILSLLSWVPVREYENTSKMFVNWILKSTYRPIHKRKHYSDCSTISLLHPFTKRHS